MILYKVFLLQTIHKFSFSFTNNGYYFSAQLAGEVMIHTPILWKNETRASEFS